MLNIALLGCAAGLATAAPAAVQISEPFDHRFKGANAAPIEGQTPFERRHGIMPGGAGFAYDNVVEVSYDNKSVAVAEDPSDHARDTRQIAQCEQLRGFFVRQCQAMHAYDLPPNTPLSAVDTRYYASDNTYELDRTYYVNDSECTPINSDIYYKLNLHGVVKYHGQSDPGINGCKAEMQWNQTDIILGQNAYSLNLAAQLNTHCPCGHHWTVGEKVHIEPGDCGSEVNPNDESLPTLCHWLAGGSDFYNYQYEPPYPNQQYYVTSRDDFISSRAYANPINYGYKRELIKESGSHNPADCTSLVWSQCAEGVIAAERSCQTCIGLECDGCLFREINPNWNASNLDNKWHTCCPCIYEYADRGMGDRDWLQTVC